MGFVAELPGANTQGRTLDEARANLREAVALILAANREPAEEKVTVRTLVREPLTVAVAWGDGN